MPEHETIEDSGCTRRRAVFKTTLPETGTSANNTGASDSENDSEEEIDMSRVVPLNQVQLYSCIPRSYLKQELRLMLIVFALPFN